MSATTALLIVIVVWIVIGVVAAIIMGRRGHAPTTWLFAGAILGPLVVPVMLASMRSQVAAVPSIAAVPATHDTGTGIDVLVGFDGSEESRGAMVTALALFGPHLGRLTIATVLDFDATPKSRAAAEAGLADVALLAAGILDRRPETAVLSGRPDDALIRYARELAFGLVVIAPRGRGASRAIFGSVASRLAHGPGIPVAIMPPAERRIIAGPGHE
jgi:nucleotide-binding universal stress UspA family protein